MKSVSSHRLYSGLPSPPARGAWIEMRQKDAEAARYESPPARGAWIEIRVMIWITVRRPSPPAWGAWIEILLRIVGS